MNEIKWQGNNDKGRINLNGKGISSILSTLKRFVNTIFFRRGVKVNHKVQSKKAKVRFDMVHLIQSESTLD